MVDPSLLRSLVDAARASVAAGAGRWGEPLPPLALRPESRTLALQHHPQDRAAPRSAVLLARPAGGCVALDGTLTRVALAGSLEGCGSASCGCDTWHWELDCAHAHELRRQFAADPSAFRVVQDAPPPPPLPPAGAAASSSKRARSGDDALAPPAGGGRADDDDGDDDDDDGGDSNDGGASALNANAARPSVSAAFKLAPNRYRKVILPPPGAAAASGHRPGPASTKTTKRGSKR